MGSRLDGLELAEGLELLAHLVGVAHHHPALLVGVEVLLAHGLHFGGRDLLQGRHVLGEEVRRRVKAQSGVELEWEIQRVGVAK